MRAAWWRFVPLICNQNRPVICDSKYGKKPASIPGACSAGIAGHARIIAVGCRNRTPVLSLVSPLPHPCRYFPIRDSSVVAVKPPAASSAATTYSPRGAPGSNGQMPKTDPKRIPSRKPNVGFS